MKIYHTYSIGPNGEVTDRFETSIALHVTVEITHTDNSSDICVLSTATNPDLIENDLLIKFFREFVYPILSVDYKVIPKETEKHLEFSSIETNPKIYSTYIKSLSEAYDKYCIKKFSNKEVEL